MSQDRWFDINQALSISDLFAKHETVFEKVGFYLSLLAIY